MWKGLGINYNNGGPGSNYQNDLALIKAAGFSQVRLLIVEYTASATINYWKAVALYALSLGFNEVIIGLSSNPTVITAANIGTFTAAVQAFAAWCQAQNNASLTLCIGNEEMFHHDGSITDSAVRAAMTANYTSCKAIYTIGKITYTMANGAMYPFYQDGNWPAKGSVSDYLSANLYAYPTGQTNGTSFTQNIANMLYFFSATTNCQISEFGPDPSGCNSGSWPDKRFYSEQFVQCLNRIIESGIPVAHIYTFQDNDTSTLFGCMDTTRIFQDWWYSLRGLKKPSSIRMRTA